MKLAFLSSSTGWGGLERNLVRYARWMSELDHEVELHCVEGTRLYNHTAATPIRLHTFVRQPRYFPFQAAAALRGHLKRNEIDVLWIRDPRDLPLCSQAVRGIQTHLLFHQGMQILAPKKRIWHHRRFGQVASWVSPLHHLKDQALANTPLQGSRIDTIPLALETEWFDRPKTENAKHIWGLPKDAQVVGLFGRMDPLKGHTTLLRALGQLQETNWHALIVGENTPNASRDFGAELVQLAAELGISERVHWRPPSEDLISAYDACNAYAMCSHSETIGMVTIEAMARKVPVVGTNAGGTPELLDYGRQGTLVQPKDATALADALRSLDACPNASDAHRSQFRKDRVLEKWSARLAALRISAS